MFGLRWGRDEPSFNRTLMMADVEMTDSVGARRISFINQAWRSHSIVRENGRDWKFRINSRSLGETRGR